MTKPKLAAEPTGPASEQALDPALTVDRSAYEPLKKTAAQKAAEAAAKEQKSPAPPPVAPSPAVVAHAAVGTVKDFTDMSDAEIVAKWPVKSPRPIASYSADELVKLQQYGPGMIGGELWLAAQKTTKLTGGGILGPAILDKGTTPLPFVSHLAGNGN